MVFDDVVVKHVCEQFAIDFPVPFEMRVGGVEDGASPFVNDGDTEIKGGHLLDVLFGNEEVVVEPVWPAWGNGIGQEQVIGARFNGNLCGLAAVLLACGDGVKPRCCDENGLKSLSRTPQIVFHRCVGFDGGTSRFAEIRRVGYDFKGGGDDDEMERNHAVSSVNILKRVGE